MAAEQGQNQQRAQVAMRSSSAVPLENRIAMDLQRQAHNEIAQAEYLMEGGRRQEEGRSSVGEDCLA